MTIYTEWKVIVAHPQPGGTMSVTNGIPDEQFDLTPYLRGLDVIQEIEFGQTAEATLSMVLDNSTGGFTPQTYDDGFVYDADRFYNNGLAWFDSWLIYVLGYADTTDGTTLASLYTFIPTDIDFVDDGYTSTISIEARDYMTWLERQKLADLSIASSNIREVLNELVQQHTTPFGADDYDIPIPPLGVTIQYGDVVLSFPDGVSVAEVIRQIAAEESLLMFPIYLGGYSAFAFISTTLVAYNWSIITSQSLLPRYDYVLRFADPDALIAGRDDGLGGTLYDLLPYRRLQMGTGFDRLTSISHMSNTSAVSSTSQNTTAIETYGARGSRYIQLPPTTQYASTEQEYLDERTRTTTTWWDTVENYVESVEITGGMISTYCADDALVYVTLLMGGGLYQETLVDILGAGGASTQGKGTFLRSVLSLTPTDWVLRLEKGLGSTSGFGLRLDSEEIGILDENKVAAPTRR